MSGLLRRLTRRRPATADETGPATPESSETAGAPADTPAEPGGDNPVPAAPEEKPVAAEDQATQVLPATGEQPTAVEQPTVVDAQPTVVDPKPGAAAQPAEAAQQPAPVRDLPAGIDPSELADAPIASARRGKLRRRLRYLRAVRDLLLRDLGGFFYEIERSAAGKASETHRRLIEAKTNRIAALDTEVRGLESRLGEPHSSALLREPGIGGTCPECGEIHASDAHYCARCGAPLDSKARARRDAAVAAAAQQTTGSHPAAEPAPASVLWAAGPRPDTAERDEDEQDTHPSLATSEWLALRPHGPAEKADAAAVVADAPAAAAKPDETAASGEASADEPATSVEAPGDEPATVAEAPGDEPATVAEAPAEEPAAKADEQADPEPEAPNERTALWLGVGKAAEEAAAADAPPAPRTAAAKKARAAAKTPGEEAPKPKRPRASRAKKAVEAETPEAEAKPKRTRAKKPDPAPEFSPEPNGRRDEPVSPPQGDPLTSRPEQGS